ncbi:hypothetical protein PUN71_012670 [Arthrobacter sp. NQ7]|uniref:hypothetical protein n=1 Tax=Arthrobacter sp. NQ7 TaxID=3032303 RepID=UPI00240F18F1|nr:hypothetical protein [Arthrobacter sp. NQ7]MDJ0458057.1 hypothetical protein [Arthrobacter sp. NQ7]
MGNQNITINGKFYPGLDGADIAGNQWARLMNAAGPKYQGARCCLDVFRAIGE